MPRLHKLPIWPNSLDWRKSAWVFRSWQMSCKKKTFWSLNWLLNLSLSRWKTFDYRERRLLHVQLSLVTMSPYLLNPIWARKSIPGPDCSKGGGWVTPSTWKNLYTKDIVVRFVNIYLVDSDLAVRQLYLFYGQLGPDGWGETTIPSTLPSTIKTTYLQSSIIKKGPNPPSPLPPYWNHLWVRRVCYLTKLNRCI